MIGFFDIPIKQPCLDWSIFSTLGFDQSRSELSVRLERAVLVGVGLPGRPWDEADPLAELRGLAETAGSLVVGQLTQKRHGLQLGTYIGTGKVRELGELVKSCDADVILFDNDLTASQIKALEKATECKVLDRSELILDIFATRARTAESRLQVELAQLEYALPRLKRMWTHLSRVKAGIGMRGPGETQLEEDRRLVGHRIRALREKLRVVQGRKEREVASRSTEPTISIVGYTNAGKSTLMNTLTGASVLAENRLFSTLDTRTRTWRLKDGRHVLLSDTVGFIRDLPHHLVASFKSTLEEARRARLLVHVVDASSSQAEEHIDAVETVLADVGCGEQPVLLVFNKIDQLPDISFLQALQQKHPRSVAVSAFQRIGLEHLEEAITDRLDSDLVASLLETVPANGKLLAWLRTHAKNVEEHYTEDCVRIECLLDGAALGQALRMGAIQLRPDNRLLPGIATEPVEGEADSAAPLDSPASAPDEADEAD